MARWTASAKWAEGPALDGQRDMPLALRLSEGLDRDARQMTIGFYFVGALDEARPGLDATGTGGA